MNEQFRNLLAQATELANEVFDYNGSDYADIVQAKFAELIVKECANRLAEDFIPEDEIIESYNDTWDSALRFGARAIKEHFGVE